MVTTCPKCLLPNVTGEEDIPYDFKCVYCNAQFCILCRYIGHFPATCTEAARWIAKGYRPTCPWYVWGDKQFQLYIDEIDNMKACKRTFEPAVLSQHRRIGFAFEEMASILQINRWATAVVCCNTHMKQRMKPSLDNLVTAQKALKASINAITLPIESLGDLDRARTNAALAVKEFLSALQIERQGPPCIDVSVIPGLRTVPAGLTLMVNGVAVDAQVDWESVMRNAIAIWNGI